MSARRMVSARFGADAVALAPDTVLEALFATISYRLEPSGWATRFPIVLDLLHEGRLDASSLDGALAELDAIAPELARVPVDRVVWNMQDLRRRNDANEPVRKNAANAFDYFVANDGRPILVCLVDAIRRARMNGDAVVLDSGLRRRNIRSGVALVVFGGAVGIGGYLYFPDAVLVPENATHEASQHGPLIWALGCLIAAMGAVATLGALLPSFGAWMRARRALVAVVAVVGVAAVGYASWR